MLEALEESAAATSRSTNLSAMHVERPVNPSSQLIASLLAAASHLPPASPLPTSRWRHRVTLAGPQERSKPPCGSPRCSSSTGYRPCP